jgi:hypothetical protein
MNAKKHKQIFQLHVKGSRCHSCRNFLFGNFFYGEIDEELREIRNGRRKET